MAICGSSHLSFFIFIFIKSLPLLGIHFLEYLGIQFCANERPLRSLGWMDEKERRF